MEGTDNLPGYAIGSVTDDAACGKLWESSEVLRVSAAMHPKPPEIEWVFGDNFTYDWDESYNPKVFPKSDGTALVVWSQVDADVGSYNSLSWAKLQAGNPPTVIASGNHNQVLEDYPSSYEGIELTDGVYVYAVAQYPGRIFVLNNDGDLLSSKVTFAGITGNGDNIDLFRIDATSFYVVWSDSLDFRFHRVVMTNDYTTLTATYIGLIDISAQGFDAVFSMQYDASRGIGFFIDGPTNYTSTIGHFSLTGTSLAYTGTSVLDIGSTDLPLIPDFDGFEAGDLVEVAPNRYVMHAIHDVFAFDTYKYYMVELSFTATTCKVERYEILREEYDVIGWGYLGANRRTQPAAHCGVTFLMDGFNGPVSEPYITPTVRVNVFEDTVYEAALLPNPYDPNWEQWPGSMQADLVGAGNYLWATTPVFSPWQDPANGPDDYMSIFVWNLVGSLEIPNLDGELTEKRQKFARPPTDYTP